MTFWDLVDKNPMVVFGCVALIAWAAVIIAGIWREFT